MFLFSEELTTIIISNCDEMKFVASKLSMIIVAEQPSSGHRMNSDINNSILISEFLDKLTNLGRWAHTPNECKTQSCQITVFLFNKKRLLQIDTASISIVKKTRLIVFCVLFNWFKFYF